jgi:hypothetical protein
MVKDKKDSKQGRPLKPDHGNKRLQHKREAWRKASKKYYDNKKKDKKTKQKSKK